VSLRIRGARVYTKRGVFEDADINIRNGYFTHEEESDEVFDATGLLAIPGLIDIHFHGAMNDDVCDGTREAFQAIADYELSQGVTAICPATLTLSVSELMDILRVGASFAKSEHTGADLIGFNMEGPFISHAKKGAQNEDYIIRANEGDVDRFLGASKGLVKIIGLAPEENPDYESYIRAVRDKVIVSLAHTNADYRTAMAAFAAGASHAVHLYNAMTVLQHRDPGVVGAVSDSPWVNAEIICDGIHIHPAAVRAAFRLNGRERMILISDSLRSTGMPDGEYLLGGQTVVKKGRYCTLREGGNLAGSVTNLADCLRHAVRHMEIPLETAVAAATINPARAIHEDRLYGSIEPGKKGDVVLLRNDEDLTLAAVIKDGRIVVDHR
jgi:N-acetylglucosamine-6-phosphate deacetylase